LKKKILLSIFLAVIILLSIGGVALATEQTLTLESKDSTNWDDEGSQVDHGTLTYWDYGSTFNYDLMVYDMPDADYSLIYYADPWPGSDSILITDVTVTDGAAQTSGSTNTGNLVNAKIWLVTADDYSEGMTSWHPGDYLFENNLISYTQGEMPVWDNDQIPDQFDSTSDQIVVGSEANWEAYNWVDSTTYPQVLADAVDFEWAGYRIQIPAGTEITNPYSNDVSHFFYENGRFSLSYLNFSQPVTFTENSAIIKFTAVVAGQPVIE